MCSKSSETSTMGTASMSGSVASGQVGDEPAGVLAAVVCKSRTPSSHCIFCTAFNESASNRCRATIIAYTHNTSIQ